MKTDPNVTNKKANPNEEKSLSETISNAHSSGDGALRLSEDGLIEPLGEDEADPEVSKDAGTKVEEY